MEAATTGAETPNLSTPATPGTPAPLFAGPRVDSLSYDRKSMPRCKCLPVDAWMAPNACVLEIPAPDVSLTRKVRHALYTLRAARSPPWMGFPLHPSCVVSCLELDFSSFPKLCRRPFLSSRYRIVCSDLTHIWSRPMQPHMCVTRRHLIYVSK
jgi:hypothetical protein